jgi:release factor glutamine methyltransferase
LIIREAVLYGQRRLAEAGIESPRLDSELILSHVLKTDRLGLLLNYTSQLSERQQKNYYKLLNFRCRHVPVAYIIRKKEFYGLDFFVRQGVLIPRPETEFLVEKTLETIQNKKNPLVADLCCGSGAIAVAMACSNNDVKVFASDISKVAVSVAVKNSIEHKVADRVFLMCGDLWQPFEESCIKNLDVVISNPPYIPSNELKNLQEDVKNEPALALDGGNDGLIIYRKIIGKARSFLKTNGSIILEIGWNQAAEVVKLLKDADFSDIQIMEDYAGFDRVVSAVSN